jgi:hypothetical protein
MNEIETQKYEEIPLAAMKNARRSGRELNFVLIDRSS